MSLPKYEWQPTTSEIAEAAGIPYEDVERFDHNTSPRPTPWAAEAATRASRNLNEYPAASAWRLRKAVARAVTFDKEMIAPGAGAAQSVEFLCGGI